MDPHTWCSVVLPQDKLQFVFLHIVVAVLLMFAFGIRVFLLNGLTDRDAPHK